jgi:hypothetical protein
LYEWQPLFRHPELQPLAEHRSMYLFLGGLDPCSVGDEVVNEQHHTMLHYWVDKYLFGTWLSFLPTLLYIADILEFIS